LGVSTGELAFPVSWKAEAPKLQQKYGLCRWFEGFVETAITPNGTASAARLVEKIDPENRIKCQVELRF
jgi:hypothetical protein